MSRCEFLVLTGAAAGIASGRQSQSRWGAKVRGRIAVVLTSTLLLWAPTARAADSEGLSLLSSANAVKVSASQGKDTAETHLALFNENPTHTKVEVRFEAASDETVHVKSVTPRRLPPEEVTRVTVVFEGLADIHEAVSGELVISGGPDPTAQSIEVTPAPQPFLPWPLVIIGLSLILAITMAVLAGCHGLKESERKEDGKKERDPKAHPSDSSAEVKVEAKHSPTDQKEGDQKEKEQKAGLSDPSPGAKWEAKSWATTLTAAGGLLGTVLGSVTFPTYPEQISKEVLTNLNLFFAALVVVGPFLFQVLRRKTLSDEELKAERIGTKRTLLVAGTVTLWAVFGQLAAFSLLSWELLSRERFFARVLIVALFGLGLGAGRYFYRTMSEAVERDWVKKEADAKTTRRKRRRKHQREQALAFFKVQEQGVSDAEACQRAAAEAQPAAKDEVEQAAVDSESGEEPEPQTMALL